VLSCGDEITACRDVRDRREGALQRHPASGVGFDD
jgi:hypothetical protein